MPHPRFLVRPGRLHIFGGSEPLAFSLTLSSSHARRTYGEAVKHHFEANGELSGVMSGVGGYECIDTTQALDSCGGCASTGEGMDCTKIRGARSVGCEASRCVVLSCDAGWRPSPRGDKCVRARSAFMPAKNVTAHASHKHVRMRMGMRHAS